MAEQALAEALQQGVLALRQGRAALAVTHLQPVAEDPTLAAQEDLRDVYARVCCLLAQALVQCGRAREANRWVEAALAAARELGDTEGIEEIRTLQKQVFGAVVSEHHAAKERRRVARASLDALLEGVEGDEARADVLLEKATAEIEAGRADEGLRLAEVVLDMHAGVRSEVLARMTVARAVPERARAELTLAWRRAERANEFNLVGAVARAADLAGVELPKLAGPDMGEDG